MYLIELLGSVRDVVDATSGALVASLDYSPYGVVQRSSGSFTPLYQFAQLLGDGNLGLALSPTRLYDPQVGRWISRDPLGEDAGINLFAYVNGSPSITVDPEGLQAEDFPNPIIKGIELLFGGTAAAVDYLINNPPQFPSIFPTSSSPAPDSTPSPTARPTTGTGGSQKPCTPNAAQQENIRRFLKKIPANSRNNVTTHKLPNGGVAVQATSPGKVPGSRAVYEKQIDINGNTTQVTKTTYDPQGNIVHVKDKL